MNIPLTIILNRKIVSSETYKYQQSLAKRLSQKRRLLENTNSKRISSNYTFEKISKWLISLNVENRIKICSIFNNWLTKIIFQMITYEKYDSVVEFSPTEKYEELAKNKKNYMYSGFNNEYKEFLIKDRYNDRQNLDVFYTYFTGENQVKKRTGSPNTEEIIKSEYKKHRKNELMKELRFVSLSEFNDTLTFSLDLINNPEKMLEYFKFFSNEQCFTSIITPIQEKNKTFNFSFPKWIYDYKTYSVHQLIMIFFEQVISIYYQLYLIDNEIPKFDIDTKFSEFFQTNIDIEDYLSKKVLNNEKDINLIKLINKENLLKSLNSDKQKNLIKYYENKLEIVYSYAFASKYDGTYFDSDLKQIGFINNKIRELMDLCQKNISLFINKICFVEPSEAFLYHNFLYYEIYNQLIELRLNQYFNELLLEDKKNKKNKKNRKKKKKQNIVKENENNINNNNNNNSKTNFEEKNEMKKNSNYEEEEIEEIPIDRIVEKKEESLEGELNNNNINNSTASSFCINKYDKDKDLNSVPKYNNFIKGDKKEEEILIKMEMEDLSKDNNKNINKENEKLKLEDINENDITEETIFNDDICINFNPDNINKKKKKKNKKRRKNNTKNDNINECNDNKKIKENNKLENIKNNEINENNNIEIKKEENNKIKEKIIIVENDKNKKNEKEKKDEIKEKGNEKEKIKFIEKEKEKGKLGEKEEQKEEKKEKVKENEKLLDNKEKDKDNIIITYEENNEKIINNNIKENIIEECNKDKKINLKNEDENLQNEKTKKKKNKEFFLFPVYKKDIKTKNKEKNNNKDNIKNNNRDFNKDINIDNNKDNIQNNIQEIIIKDTIKDNINDNNKDSSKDNIKDDIKVDNIKDIIKGYNNKDIIKEHDIKDDININNSNEEIPEKNINQIMNDNQSTPINNNNKKENSTQTDDFCFIYENHCLYNNINKNKLLVKTNETKIEYSGTKNKKKLNKKSERINNNIINNLKTNNSSKKNSKMNNLYDIKNETNLQINSTKLDSNKNHDIKYDINNYNIQYFNNFYYINQAQYPNFGPYQNINNSFSNTQNELFTLNEEILNFEKKVDNNLKSIKIYREQIINIITNFISKVLYKNYEFEFLFYGSYSTGLSIELSDIDILIKYTIKSNNNNLNTYQNIENIISLLEKAFNKNKEKLKINQVNPIYTASVPVLKIECNLKEIIPEKIQEQLKTDYLFNFENDILKLNFDFTFNEFNNNIKKSIPSQEIIKNIKNAIEIYPNIRPILLVLKRYMQITRLNSSFHGGISSYSLFLLLYAYYLQFYEKNTNKNNNKENLGRDLLGFFSFYGNFNFGIYSIDVRNNIPINLLDKRHQNYILLIDPITGLNVAKSTFRIEDIKYVFNNAVMIINNSFFEKMNNIENNNILNELFNQFNYNNFIYNNSFIPHQ